MMRRFKDGAMCQYFYNPYDKCVYSEKSGTPTKLKWCQNGSAYDPTRVRMSVNGQLVSKTLNQVLDALLPVEAPAVTHSPEVRAANVLGNIVPVGAYVMFSTKNKASQYFLDGTSIKEALALFARRNININPTDIQILNVTTGKVSKVTVKVVETMYMLD